jgi:hypothetical protein
MKKITTAILILADLQLAGCVSTQVVYSENLSYDQSKALRIEMNDGSIVRLPGGKYQVVGKSDSLTIIGKGIRIDLSKGNSEIPFNATIRASEIRQIETVEPSGIVYTIPIYIGIVTAIGLIILISMGGRGVGG